jgi:murein L,D-transpeptidase YafK
MHMFGGIAVCHARDVCAATRGISHFGESSVTVSQPEAPAPPLLADHVVVRKSKRTLELLHDGTVFESFPIALGREPRGPKRKEGDGRTPEGIYRIDSRSLQTRYTRALHISYPDGNDRDRARALKVDPGGAIFTHGLPSDYGPFDPPHWYRDWTEGCISVGNAAIVLGCRARRNDGRNSSVTSDPRFRCDSGKRSNRG